MGKIGKVWGGEVRCGKRGKVWGGEVRCGEER